MSNVLPAFLQLADGEVGEFVAWWDVSVSESQRDDRVLNTLRRNREDNYMEPSFAEQRASVSRGGLRKDNQLHLIAFVPNLLGRHANGDFAKEDLRPLTQKVCASIRFWPCAPHDPCCRLSVSGAPSHLTSLLTWLSTATFPRPPRVLFPSPAPNASWCECGPRCLELDDR